MTTINKREMGEFDNFDGFENIEFTDFDHAEQHRDILEIIAATDPITRGWAELLLRIIDGEYETVELPGDDTQ